MHFFVILKKLNIINPQMNTTKLVLMTLPNYHEKEFVICWKKFPTFHNPSAHQNPFSAHLSHLQRSSHTTWNAHHPLGCEQHSNDSCAGSQARNLFIASWNKHNTEGGLSTSICLAPFHNTCWCDVLMLLWGGFGCWKWQLLSPTFILEPIVGQKGQPKKISNFENLKKTPVFSGFDHGKWQVHHLWSFWSKWRPNESPAKYWLNPSFSWHRLSVHRTSFTLSCSWMLCFKIQTGTLTLGSGSGFKSQAHDIRWRASLRRSMQVRSTMTPAQFHLHLFTGWRSVHTEQMQAFVLNTVLSCYGVRRVTRIHTTDICTIGRILLVSPGAGLSESDLNAHTICCLCTQCTNKPGNIRTFIHPLIDAHERTHASCPSSKYMYNGLGLKIP